MFDAIVDGRHIIACPPHMLVSALQTTTRPHRTTVHTVTKQELTFSRPGDSYMVLLQSYQECLDAASHLFKLGLDIFYLSGDITDFICLDQHCRKARILIAVRSQVCVRII